MVSYRIEDVKQFMGELLTKETFDSFYTTELQIKTFMEINISGKYQKDWEDDILEEQKPEFVSWKQVRPLAFQMIKGKHTPGLLMINFMKRKEDGDSGVMRVHYQNGELRIVSGYARQGFSLDKSREQDWDGECGQFLHQCGLEFHRED